MLCVTHSFAFVSYVRNTIFIIKLMVCAGMLHLQIKAEHQAATCQARFFIAL